MSDHDLRSPDGRAAADAAISALIRAGRLVEAETWLTGALSEHPGAVATACLAVPPDGVTIRGWDELDADLTRLVRGGHHVSAVGLNLSNYHDTDADDWWDKEPAVEVTAYTDEHFPFSTATLQEMLAASATYAAPWTGAGLGQDEVHPRVSGLRGVNGALLRHQEERGRTFETDDDLAAYLGWWWQHLRFRQAVAGHLDAHGLALTVPVLAGSHDVGPWLVTVHPVMRESEHHARTEELLAERARLHLERYDAVTNETVAELVSLREGSRGGWGWRNRDKRRTYVGHADARLALVCRWAGLGAPTASIDKLGDAEFDAIVTGWVAHRRDASGRA